MRKLCAVILSAVVWLVAAGTPASAAEHQSTLSAGYLQTHTDMPAGIAVMRFLLIFGIGITE